MRRLVVLLAFCLIFCASPAAAGANDPLGPLGKPTVGWHKVVRQGWVLSCESWGYVDRRTRRPLAIIDRCIFIGKAKPKHAGPTS